MALQGLGDDRVWFLTLWTTAFELSNGRAHSIYRNIEVEPCKGFDFSPLMCWQRWKWWNSVNKCYYNMRQKRCSSYKHGEKKCPASNWLAGVNQTYMGFCLALPLFLTQCGFYINQQKRESQWALRRRWNFGKQKQVFWHHRNIKEVSSSGRIRTRGEIKSKEHVKDEGTKWKRIRNQG